MLETQPGFSHLQRNSAEYNAVNEQESNFKELSLPHVAGLFDAEATFYISDSKSIAPYMTFPNTDFDLINRVYCRLRSIGIGSYIYDKNQKRFGEKPQKVLMVFGIKRHKNFIPMISQYLNLKREIAELLLKYSESRLSKPKMASYDEYEKSCPAQSKKLNAMSYVELPIYSFSKEVEIQRLVGLIEGEGNFSLKPDMSLKGSRKRFQIVPEIDFTNKSVRLLSEVKLILDAIGIRYGFYPNAKSEGTYTVRVSNCNQVEKLLVLISEYLIGTKFILAEHLAEFCERRKVLRNRSYEDRDFELLNTVSAINCQGTRRIPTMYSSTTVRLALEKSRVMIQSDLHGDMQSAAEMTVPSEATC
jgi:hypothetical protein